MKITIDNNSGFCFGVVYAIEKAELILNNQNDLFCLGDIVHNDAEVQRLEKLGLKIIDKDYFSKLKNKKVLIRAHGEPPDTYKIAKENNIEIIDASCPIVLRLQMNIRKKYEELKPLNGQIVIFGKKGHAEVVGLSGQTDFEAIIVSNSDDLNSIDFSKPIAVFSQTTQSNDAYLSIVEQIKQNLKTDNFYFQDSLCRQVSNRNEDLKLFCSQQDIVIFLSGSKSSNGKMLYEICKSANENTKLVSDLSEIKKEWFLGVENVGISGATSTPKWFIQKAKEYIESLF